MKAAKRSPSLAIVTGEPGLALPWATLDPCHQFYLAMCSLPVPRRSLNVATSSVVTATTTSTRKDVIEITIRPIPDEHPKIIGALHSRIPMVTPEDIRAVQEESFKDDERFWDTMRDMNASHIEGLKGHIALAEAKIAAMEAGESQGGRGG